MKIFGITVCTLFMLAARPAAAGQIAIAAAIPDLGSIAASIGGEKVTVFSIAKSKTNPHLVEVLPSYMVKASKAALYLKVGLSLDQWSDEIVDGARNARLRVVDCSRGIPVLQKPAGRVDASQGDVHPEGNPHYWLDPANGIVIAKTIADVLKQTDPENSAYYDTNYRAFVAESEERIAAWKLTLAPLAGRKIITYHSSWVYFAHAFHLENAGTVEPLPGIPPTGKHLAALVETIQKQQCAFLLQEPYFPDDAPHFLARTAGIRVIKFPPSCESPAAGAYLAHIGALVGQVAEEGRPS